MLIVISMLMGAVLGFAAHRAGLCTVKAVAEILTARRAHFLWSFIKSALWTTALTALAATLLAPVGFKHWPAGGLSIAGGLLFGVGAGVNGGCTFSTLSRLMDGSLHFIATLLMWPVGILAALAIFPQLVQARPETHFVAGAPWWLGAPIALFLVGEIVVLTRNARRAGSARRFLGAHVYSLTAGAALLGAANAALLLASGPWSFIGTLLCGMKAQTVARCEASSYTPMLVLAAALAGMAFSTWQRKSFRPQRPELRALLRHAAGGLLMGFGAVLIPGGNEGLILFGIPSLSPHALPAYVAILAGVGAALLTRRALGGAVQPVICGPACR